MDYLRGPEVITSPPERDAGGVRVGGEGNMMTESETETMSFEHGRGGHKPRKIGGPIELKKTKKQDAFRDPTTNQPSHCRSPFQVIDLNNENLSKAEGPTGAPVPWLNPSRPRGDPSQNIHKP